MTTPDIFQDLYGIRRLDIPLTVETRKGKKI